MSRQYDRRLDFSTYRLAFRHACLASFEAARPRPGSRSTPPAR